MSSALGIGALSGSNNTTRVLGIDTSLRSSGVAVVEAEGNRFSAVGYRTIKVPQKEPVTECLRRIHVELTEFIKSTEPDVASMEGAFFSKNAKTAMILGQARGVALAVCALADLPVYEYAPRRVKQAVTGYGAASKEQVRKMMESVLSLDGHPRDDESDALAIAMCHLHNRTGHAALAPSTI